MLDARNPIRSIRIGSPAAIAVGDQRVWALDVTGGVVSAIGPTKIEVSIPSAPGGRPIALAIAAGSLWVLDQADSSIGRFDAIDGHPISRVAVAPNPTLLASAAGYLWVASSPTNTLVRIDPATETTLELRPDIGSDARIGSIGGDDTHLWLGSRNGIFGLDPASGAVIASWIGSGYVLAVGGDGGGAILLTVAGELLQLARR